MQTSFDEETGYPIRVGSFEHISTGTYTKPNNCKTSPSGFENTGYLEPFLKKNLHNSELIKSYKLPNYFIISSLGIWATFVYEIMALFRIFTLFRMEEIPALGLINSIRSFEVFFSTSAALNIAFTCLMYHGLYHFINSKWVKMCKYASKIAGEAFINNTKDCVLEKVSQNCRDQEKFKHFGKQLTTALDYAIKEFECDKSELSECYKYVWNKSKCSMCKLQTQCVILPIAVTTIAQSLLGAYVYYIAMYYHRVPLAHPTLITELRWFAAIQYEGLLWISFQCTISLIASLLVYRNSKQMPYVIEKYAEKALGDADHFANILVNHIWNDKLLLLSGNGDEAINLGSRSICCLFGSDADGAGKIQNDEMMSNSTYVFPNSNDYKFASINNIHECINDTVG